MFEKCPSHALIIFFVTDQCSDEYHPECLGLDMLQHKDRSFICPACGNQYKKKYQSLSIDYKLKFRTFLYNMSLYVFRILVVSPLSMFHV